MQLLASNISGLVSSLEYVHDQSRNYRVRQGTRRVRAPSALMQQRAPYFTYLPIGKWFFWN